MSGITKSVKSGLAWFWARTSAAVALLLIITSLVVGYRLGGLGAPPTEASTAGAHEHGIEDEDTKFYTCSMHPNVRLEDPDAKCPICFMELIPVVENGDSGMEARFSMSPSAAAMSRIETTPVRRFFPTGEARLHGKVTYDETSVARLTAYFPGRIDRLFVNYPGVPVNKGEHVAEVFSPELLAAFEELRQSSAAVARIAGEESGLLSSTTRRTLIAAREKLRLFGVTPEQIDAVEDGTFDSDRLTVFAPIGGVVTHLSVREGDYVQTGDPIATVADLTRLWLDLEAFESQLPLLRWGQHVSFTVEAHPGETFQGTISFIEPIVDEHTRTAAVRVAVDNTEHRLKPGMFASAVIRPRLGTGGAVVSDEYAGRWVCPMHPSIVADEFGACEVCGMDLESAESLGVVGDPSLVEAPLVIPRTAVLFTGTRSVVYVEVPGAEQPTYEPRNVVLGPRAGEHYLVIEGVDEGESVVTHGAFRIDSAMQISGKPSMMNPSGGPMSSSHAGHAGSTDAPASVEPDSGGVPESFVLELGPVYTSYLGAQESLAGDDFEGYLEARERFDGAMSEVDQSDLEGVLLVEWNRVSDQVRSGARASNIEEARAQFHQMSLGVIELQNTFGHVGGEIWSLVHCPMAFDFEGADWVQRGTEISNPYFGDAMLRCGTVKQTLEPRPQPTRETDTHEGHNDG